MPQDALGHRMGMHWDKLERKVGMRMHRDAELAWGCIEMHPSTGLGCTGIGIHGTAGWGCITMLS